MNNLTFYGMKALTFYYISFYKTVLLKLTTTVYFVDFALNSILIDERLGFLSNN